MEDVYRYPLIPEVCVTPGRKGFPEIKPGKVTWKFITENHCLLSYHTEDCGGVPSGIYSESQLAASLPYSKSVKMCQTFHM